MRNPPVRIQFRIVAGFACAVSATVAAGQAPHITEAGDPSVASDTIYSLAVDSTVYPEQSTVLLLDDGVVRVEQDGRGTRTFRQVVQILRDRAATAYREREFRYDPDHQRLTVNWIRVLKPDGDVISPKPSQTQESDVPAALSDPVYVHRKVYRASLTGVAPGTLVDLSWTIEEQAPFRPGDFFQRWRVTAGTTVRRSRFLVDAPKDMALRITERNLDFHRSESVVADRRVYVWATHDVPWIRPELYTPALDSNGTDMAVAVAAPGSWSDIGEWYAGLARDRLRADSTLADTVRGVIAHATTLDDSVRAIYRWVAQDVRYVSVALGLGGYQPRAPAVVLSTGFGDCKDKATLFIAALSTIGVQAYSVLLDAGGHPDRTLPTITAFNHAIAAIKRPSGYQFVDPTAELSPFATLPPTDYGRFALIIHPDGRTEEVTTTPRPPNADLTEARVIGTLAPDGTFGGRVEVRASGTPALALRAAMTTRMDSTQRGAFLRSMAAMAFPNAHGDSLVTFDGKDLSADPRISYVIRNGEASRRSGTTDVLLLHEGFGQLAQVADELEAQGPRRMPIDAAKVLGAVTILGETRIALPDGWRARLPVDVAAKSAFGDYASVYRQDGRDLVITHRLQGATGILSRDHAGELIAWLRAIGKDYVPLIILDHGA